VLDFPRACDCHARLWNPGSAAELALYDDTAQPLGLQRVVFVQPDGQRPDHTPLTSLLRSRRHNARGVARVSLLTPEATLEQMRLDGVRGLRLTLAADTDPTAAAGELVELTARAARRRCHVELDAPSDLLAALVPAIRDAECVVLIDRMADARAERGLNQPGLDDILDLLAAGRVWVKLNGAEKLAYDTGDGWAALPFMRALIATNADQLVWGSDWPGDSASALEVVTEAAETPAQLRRILVDNPARLYGFTA
jgi:predicted TIM-barrel fold metal-dependent hydrolase